MTPSEQAERARAILEDVLFKEAINQIRERHLSAFENSAPDNPDARERAYYALRAATELQNELQSAIDDVAMMKGRHRAND